MSFSPQHQGDEHGGAGGYRRELLNDQKPEDRGRDAVVGNFCSTSYLYPKALAAANSSEAKDLFYRRNSDLIKILLPDLMFL